MGHNSVVSGHPKSTRILWVDGLSTGPPDLGCQSLVSDDYLGAQVGVSTSVFEYWLVTVEYRELGVWIPRISGHGCRTRHYVH